MANETIITVIGNLTADPETRTVSKGDVVVNFTVASTPRNFNRQTNQYEDGETLFIRCNAWRELASHIAQSLYKGVRVIVQGKLQQRSYQAKDGSNRSVYELQVDEIGPSLRGATARVQKVQHGYQGAPQGAPQNGFNQPNAQPNGFQQQQQPVQAQGADPWGANNNQPSTFGNFGNDTDF